MYISLFFSNWCSDSFSPDSGNFSIRALMIHPVSSTALPSVMCTWSLVLFLVEDSICFVFLYYFNFILFYATCLALHEATARVCICLWLELCPSSVSLPELLPEFLLEKLLQSRALPCSEGFANAKEKSDLWFVHFFSSPALGNILDQNCTAREVYNFIQSSDGSIYEFGS